jgi:hypothetical protein
VQALEVGMSGEDVQSYLEASEKLKTATGEEREALLADIAAFE